jgi:succinyl-CoA synthetase beta subunit
MNIHEYQAKSLLARYGVAVPRGDVAHTAQEAERVAKQMGGPAWVVKSQIHAGGRGAGRFKDNPQGKGGVRVVRSIDDASKTSAKWWVTYSSRSRPGPPAEKSNASISKRAAR